jgi:hypothetical protein
LYARRIVQAENRWHNELTRRVSQREVMKQNKVVSFAEYKAQLLCAAKSRSREAAESTFPGADRLWELLDRNINLSVWEKGH